MLKDWAVYLNFVKSHVGLDEEWGISHQGAALLTWVSDVVDGVPEYRVEIDHPGQYNPTPTKINVLPDLDHRYIRRVSDHQRQASEECLHGRIGGVWTTYPITERAWVAGDLALVVVVASEAALDEMISPSYRLHLPLMRVYVDTALNPDANFAPADPFTSAQVTIISNWFADLGTNGNSKYSSGITPTQLANFFNTYYPIITSPAEMSTWMQAHPRSDSIYAFNQIFEFAP